MIIYDYQLLVVTNKVKIKYGDKWYCKSVSTVLIGRPIRTRGLGIAVRVTCLRSETWTNVDITSSGDINDFWPKPFKSLREFHLGTKLSP